MKVACFGTFGGRTGYSSCTRGFTKFLRTMGIDVDIFPLQAPDQRDQWWKTEEIIAEKIKNADGKNKYDIKLLFANPFALDNFEDPTEFVLHTVWETDRIPVQFVHRSMATRHVLVGSKFSQEVFAKDGIESDVSHEGYDEHVFYPEKLPHSRFRFVCVAEWMPRKNLPKLIKVFADTFEGKNDVELFLKTWNSHGLPPGEIEQVIHYFNRSRARIIPLFNPMPDSKMRDLYAQCDVSVSSTYGEGFGRTQLESMACGLPNIVTGWSAHTEFINNKNGWLVDYNLEPVLPHFTEYSDDQMWAQIDDTDLSEKMLYAYEHQREVQEKGIKSIEDAKPFTWPKVTRTLITNLEKICDKA